jgi:hypothetical protein
MIMAARLLENIWQRDVVANISTLFIQLRLYCKERFPMLILTKPAPMCDTTDVIVPASQPTEF